jgi:hypothetical protein
MKLHLRILCFLQLIQLILFRQLYKKDHFFETVTIGFRCSEGFLYSTPSMEKLSAPEGHFCTVLIICLVSAPLGSIQGLFPSLNTEGRSLTHSAAWEQIFLLSWIVISFPI